MAVEKIEAFETMEDVDAKTPHVEAAHLEHSLRAGLSYEDATYVHEFGEQEHSRAFRKVDWHLMPMLMALYLIANLDRYVIENGTSEE
jgi:hypothetical protein